MCIRNNSTEVKKSCGRRLTVFNVHGAESKRLALDQQGKGLWKTTHITEPCLLQFTVTEIKVHNEKGPWRTPAMHHSPPDVTCPSVTTVKSLRQRQKVLVITVWGRREQGITRADQVLHKGRKFARWHLPRKACFMQQKRRGKRKTLLPLTPSKQPQK